jgi:hypothetical protein
MAAVTTKTASARTPLVVLSAVAVAASAAASVALIRLANPGFEPAGRNWWLVAEVVLGLSYVPVGCALLTRGRRGLGLACVLVGASQVAAAILAELHAWYPSTAPLLDAAQVVEIAGLLVLALVVPFLVPWPRDRVTKDRLTNWLALGVVTAAVGCTAATFDNIGDLPGAHVAAPLLLVSTVPLLAVGAFVADARDDPLALATVSHRFLVWGILASGIVVLYTVLVAGFGSVLGANGPAWLLVGVTGGLAMVLEPVRARLRHFVDDLVYGQRDDPLAVVRQLVGQQIATETDVDERLLVSIAGTLAGALRLDPCGDRRAQFCWLGQGG